jgi:endonuclease/exonuclease/phosphatase (EEP) superfamily protein YafD
LIHFFLSCREAESNRLKELHRLQALVNSFGEPALIGGDWNFCTHNPLTIMETRLLPLEWKEAKPAHGTYSMTFDTDKNPVARRLSRGPLIGDFDHIFYRAPAHLWASNETRVVIPDGECSDHFPLLTTIVLA